MSDKIESICRRVARQIIAVTNVDLGFDVDDVYQEARIVALTLDKNLPDFGARVHYGTRNALTLRYKTRRVYRDALASQLLSENVDDDLDLIESFAVAKDRENEIDASIDAHEIMARLSPDVREIVRRHYLNDETLQTLSKEYGVAPNTLRYRMDIAFALIRGENYRDYLKWRADKAQTARGERLRLLDRDATTFAPDVRQCVELARSGMNEQEIADATGLSSRAVSRKIQTFISRQNGTFVEKKASKRRRCRERRIQKQQSVYLDELPRSRKEKESDNARDRR